MPSAEIGESHSAGQGGLAGAASVWAAGGAGGWGWGLAPVACGLRRAARPSGPGVAGLACSGSRMAAFSNQVLSRRHVRSWQLPCSGLP